MVNIAETKDLYVEYRTEKGISGEKEIVKAVNGVNLDVNQGEILAIAGESGCGKSTLARALMKLEPIKSGKVLFSGKDISDFTKEELKNFRQKVQMVFQNPFSSLNPKMTILQILSEPLEINTRLNKTEIKQIVLDKIRQVGLSEDILDLYPHEFSGGQRQRIAIARALVMDPEFIIADEPVSALDVSIQAQIINLLKKLKDEFNLTIILITHDMRVIEYLADRVAVMYLGEIVESGKTKEIFNSPKHPYTKALMSSVPKIIDKNKAKIILSGDLPSPTDLPSGCKFHTRCNHCMDICVDNNPDYTYFSDCHQAKCFLYNKCITKEQQ